VALRPKPKEIVQGGLEKTTPPVAAPPLRPGSLAGRQAPLREQLLREGGGTEESEAAVARGLAWIVRQQRPEGSWSFAGYDRGYGTDSSVWAATGLALLPLLGTGHTHQKGDYAPQVDQGLKYLLRVQPADGGYAKSAYQHCIPTLALCEAYALTKDPQLKEPAQRALDFIVRAQHAGGGWRYDVGQPGDTSCTGWALMALKTGRLAGLDVPEDTLRRVSHFLDDMEYTDRSGYGYDARTNGGPTTCAIGLLGRLHLGWEPRDARVRKGVETLSANPPSRLRNIYYCYYATQVLRHVGGAAWKGWNAPMRSWLLDNQEKDPSGKATGVAGSWSPVGDAFGKAGGRLMVTSLALLSLEAYYRHVPFCLARADGLVPERDDKRPQEGWISIMPTDEEVSRTSVAKYESGVLRVQGAWAAFSSGKYQARNAIIRVVVKKLEGQSINLNLRDNGLTYKALYSGDGLFAIHKSVSEDGKIRWVQLAEGRSSKPYNDFFEFAFKAEDDLLTVEADGVEVVRARDSTYDGAGFLKFGAFQGQGLFKKAEIRILDGAAKSASQQPAVLPGAVGKPELVRLDELKTTVFGGSPWVSPDGLTIYWQATEAGKPPAWIWTASRKNPSAPFENKQRLLPGRHPTLTPDGLQMILLNPRADGQKGESLHVVTRPARDWPFGHPREIAELRPQTLTEEREAPCLSADGLTLYFQRSEKGSAEFWFTTRARLDAKWEAPQRLPMVLDRLPDRKLTWPFVTTDRLTLYCTHEGSAGKFRLMVWSRKSPSEPFADFRYLEVPNVPDLFGRAPRYVEATNELFFNASGPEGQGVWDLRVIKNYKP
jgi:hypothetical protein